MPPRSPAAITTPLRPRCLAQYSAACKQFVGLIAILCIGLRQSHAEREGRDRRLAGRGWPSDGRAQGFGQHDGCFRSVAGTGDHEFVAAEAAEQVVADQVLAHHADDPLERRVAQQVAVTVVDRLEVIEVEHDQGQWLVVSGQMLDAFAQLRRECLPVERAGQRIMHRQLLQLLRLLLQVAMGRFQEALLPRQTFGLAPQLSGAAHRRPPRQQCREQRQRKQHGQRTGVSGCRLRAIRAEAWLGRRHDRVGRICNAGRRAG